MSNKLELTWYGKEDKVSVEPRILIENKELSNTEHDKNIENILIHGDVKKAIRKSHKNPQVIKLYEEYLGEPYGEKAHELLHTTYVPRARI